ncbi:MSMEG_0570 family nitrogen starvation response protein [Zavarzinia compransoris]|uniref:MSMEG_0570 family nitrogen starvation response protein n=1 Tax=Zavarzinia marina TaxID=2911065 RepID=UPI001F29F20B|nr:MSMEG_0570 family nitrogen starvation response protein [Zavarzinia marina]MCF4166134.1 MSMEG_0570 family nitrogen starvation response protein [Zavarzinia marina]
MPEVWFDVRWPDGTDETCYSPSTAITDHLAPGATYEIAEFVARSRAGLGAASDRVKARYGYPCSRAMGQLARIERTAARHAGNPGATVTISAMSKSGSKP